MPEIFRCQTLHKYSYETQILQLIFVQLILVQLILVQLIFVLDFRELLFHINFYFLYNFL